MVGWGFLVGFLLICFGFVCCFVGGFLGWVFFCVGVLCFGFGEAVIEPFLPLFLSCRHKLFSIIKALTEGNLY